MKNLHKGLGVKNMPDQILKENIYGIYKTKKLAKEQIKRYKMNQRDF